MMQTETRMTEIRLFFFIIFTSFIVNEDETSKIFVGNTSFIQYIVEDSS